VGYKEKGSTTKSLRHILRIFTWVSILNVDITNYASLIPSMEQAYASSWRYIKPETTHLNKKDPTKSNTKLDRRTNHCMGLID
jgi:hypothetical protein